MTCLCNFFPLNFLKLFYGRDGEALWALEWVFKVEIKRKSKGAKAVMCSEVNRELKSDWKKMTSYSGQPRNIYQVQEDGIQRCKWRSSTERKTASPISVPYKTSMREEDAKAWGMRSTEEAAVKWGIRLPYKITDKYR